jgi:hypothetical protein
VSSVALPSVTKMITFDLFNACLYALDVLAQVIDFALIAFVNPTRAHAEPQAQLTVH